METVTKVYNDHPKTVLFSTAAGLRILLALVFPELPDLLTGRVEISTPEGLFLYERGLDPYDGGIFHQAPLLLPLFSLLPSPLHAFGRILSVILFTSLDLLSANCLFGIAETVAAPTSRLFVSPRKEQAWKPLFVAAAYLFNPYTLLACLGRPTTIFATFFVLLSVHQACQAKLATSIFAIAIASYMTLQPVFLLPLIGMLCYDRVCLEQGDRSAEKDQNGPRRVSTDQRSFPAVLPFALQIAALFVGATAFLLALSRLLLPSWQFIPSVYATLLQLPDLTPNIGLWWYFFIEMFDAFRAFFLGVFWLHMLAYSVPFCVRFKKQPLAGVVLMMGVLAIFEPYANIGNVGSFLSSLCLLGHVFELSSTYRYTFPALAALLYTTLLGPAFHHLWIYAGSGNANFFYAITLVWNLALIILLTDTVYAVLRDEWESERPEGKGAEVRQM